MANANSPTIIEGKGAVNELDETGWPLVEPEPLEWMSDLGGIDETDMFVHPDPMNQEIHNGSIEDAAKIKIEPLVLPEPLASVAGSPAEENDPLIQPDIYPSDMVFERVSESEDIVAP